jgi:outer membrane protein assembly factor BamB
VLKRVAVDRHSVYFGSRDGHCYCVDRTTGKLRWKTDLNSAVVASPVLASWSGCDVTTSVYAIGIDGSVCCLDPFTGEEVWTFKAEAKSAPHHWMSSPRVLVSRTPTGDRRQLYFGAASNGLSVPALYCLEDQLKQR